MGTDPAGGTPAPNPKSSALSRASVPLILAATAVAYIGTLSFGFVYDDHQQIVLNPVLRYWRYVPYYFVHDVWSQRSVGEVSNYYRPVFLLWLRLSDALFGLRPAGWHAASVALHLLTTWLVFRLARRLLANRWQAYFAAAFFGLNPIHLEAVAWVSGSNEPLVAALMMASFLCYLDFRGARHKAWLAASLLFFLLAALAKETALILPFLVFGYAWIYTEGERPNLHARLKQALTASLPYALIAVSYLVMRVSVLGAVGRAMTAIPRREVIYTWPSVLWFYARLMVWPAGLSVFYDMPYIAHPGVASFFAPLAGLALIGAALVAWSLRSKIAAFALLWLVLPLAPVLDFRVFGRGDIAHDRYLYLPSVGLAILAALLISRVRLGPMRLLGRPAGPMIAGAAILVSLAIGTVWQSQYWANDIVLCYRGMKVAPENAYARNSLGVALMDKSDWKEAILLFHQASDRDPGFMDPHSNLALLYYRIGQYRASEDEARKALRLDDDDSGTWFVLGVDELGLRHLDQAEAMLRHAIFLAPRAFGFHYGLGVTLETAGDLKGALEEFKAEPSDSPKAAAAKQQIASIETRLRSQVKEAAGRSGPGANLNK